MPEVWAPPALDDVSTDEFVTAAQLSALGNSLRWLEPIYYNTFTGTVNVTSTTATSPDTIISSGAISYEAGDYWVEFFCPSITGSNGVQHHVQVADGTTELCRIGSEARVTNALTYNVNLKTMVTLTAASHTIMITGYNGSAGTIAYNPGAGGSASTNCPGHLLITRVIPALNP